MKNFVTRECRLKNLPHMTLWQPNKRRSHRIEHGNVTARKEKQARKLSVQSHEEYKHVLKYKIVVFKKSLKHSDKRYVSRRVCV